MGERELRPAVKAVLLFAVLCAAFFVIVFWISGTTYDPATWTGTCATGRRQSPVDLGGNGTVSKSIPNLRLSHLGAVGTLTMRNTGLSVMLSGFADWPNRPTLTSGGLNATYTLHQMHFHWGREPTEGSEHTVEGDSYPAECHFVFLRDDKHGEHGEEGHAEGHEAVVAVFLELGEDGSALRHLEEGLERSVTFTMNNPNEAQQPQASDFPDYWAAAPQAFYPQPNMNLAANPNVPMSMSIDDGHERPIDSTVTDLNNIDMHSQQTHNLLGDVFGRHVMLPDQHFNHQFQVMNIANDAASSAAQLFAGLQQQSFSGFPTPELPSPFVQFGLQAAAAAVSKNEYAHPAGMDLSGCVTTTRDVFDMDQRQTLHGIKSESLGQQLLPCQEIQQSLAELPPLMPPPPSQQHQQQQQQHADNNNGVPVSSSADAVLVSTSERDYLLDAGGNVVHRDAFIKADPSFLKTESAFLKSDSAFIKTEPSFIKPDNNVMTQLMPMVSLPQNVQHGDGLGNHLGLMLNNIGQSTDLFEQQRAKARQVAAKREKEQECMPARNPETSAASQKESAVCQICLIGSSNGLHFGAARTCAACAAFFRRSVSDSKSYSCKRPVRCKEMITEEGEICNTEKYRANASQGYRKMCRKCRFSRCVAMGMQASKVQHKRNAQKSGDPDAQQAIAAQPDSTMGVADSPVINELGHSYVQMPHPFLAHHHQQQQHLQQQMTAPDPFNPWSLGTMSIHCGPRP